MLVGESWSLEFAGFRDFFNAVVRELWRRGMLLAGTSANRSEASTYSIHDQHALARNMESDVDFLVLRRKLPPISARSCFASSTIWDLTGSLPKLRREGSVHPHRFRSILGEYIS